MELDLKDNIRVINKIEDEFDIHSLRSNGLYIWPLIRIFLADRAKEFGKADQSGGKSSKVELLREGFKRYRRAKKENKRNAGKLPKNPEILFFTGNTARNEIVEGKTFSKFADSFVHFAKGIAEVLVLESSHDSRVLYNKFNPVYNLDETIFRYQVRNKIKRSNLDTDDDALNRFFVFLKEHKIENRFHLNKTDLNDKIGLLNQYIDLCTDILKRFKPKACVVTGLNSVFNMALCASCRALGVKTVELQHGQQGDYNNMYTRWNNVPVNGYDLLPEYFWTWGEISKKRFEKWMVGGNYHKAIVGGNTWLTFKKNELSGEITELNETFNRRALICMQEPELFYESNLPEAIESTPDVLWLIRLHPRYPAERKKLEKTFSEREIPNVEFSVANSAGIYDLLRTVDVVVTFWSTVAYEAQAFEVPTVIIHKNGYEGMREYIDQGCFEYAANLNTLVSAVRTKQFKESISPYILNDTEVIRSTISSLL